jgi:hypothetical protein
LKKRLERRDMITMTADVMVMRSFVMVIVLTWVLEMH